MGEIPWKSGQNSVYLPWKSGQKRVMQYWKSGKNMIKRKIDRYLEQYFVNDHKALLLTGARQIGKTFSIRHFAQSHFETFVEINFIDNPGWVKGFAQAKNSQDILLRLSTLTTRKLVKGKTLIFFDEVQECPEIVTAVKFLVEEELSVYT